MPPADKFAIFQAGGTFTVWFWIDQRWWPVTNYLGHMAEFTCSQDAVRHLARAYSDYETEYGDRLLWDLSHVPVVQVPTERIDR